LTPDGNAENDVVHRGSSFDPGQRRGDLAALGLIIFQ
jgi:hypothetical protein